jgi:hypothetical protein
MKRLNYLLILNVLIFIGLCPIHVIGAGGPDVSIIEPMDSAYFIAGKEYTVVAEAYDSVGIDSVIFLINGAKKKIDTSEPYDYTATYTSGNYLIQAKAYNADTISNSDYIRIYAKDYDVISISNTFEEVALDGVMEDVWENDTTYVISNMSSGTIDDEDDLSGNFKLQYSSEGLYFLVNVRDNHLSAEHNINQISENDGVELFLDLNNHKRVFYEQDDYHYVFCVNGMMVEKNNKSTENIDFIVNKNPVGYVVEGFIPWETLSHDPMANEFIGFEMKIIDSDEGVKEGKLSWWETAEMAPSKTSVFGVAQYKDIVEETTPPGTPVIVGPADGDTAKSQTPVFTWQAVADESGILNYELDINGSVHVVPGDETNFISDTLINGDYTWKIRAIDKDRNTGAWTSVYNLVVDSLFNDITGPDAPELLMPYNDADLDSASPLFTWKPVYDIDGPVSYEIQVDDSVYNVGQNTYYQAPPLPETDSMWRVRATDVNGNVGNWSITRTFSLKGVVNLALNKEVAAESVQIHPEISLESGNDGDMNTRWGSKFYVPTWWYVDLGQVYEFNRIKIMWESAFALGYHLQTAKDTNNWSTIYSRCLKYEIENVDTCKCDTGTWDAVYDELEETYYDHYEEEITGISDSARFIRLYTTIKKQNGVSFWEFEVFKGTPREDTTTPSAPTIIYPAHGDTTKDNTPAFKWGKVIDIHSGIDKYEISIDDSIYNAGTIDFFNARSIMSEGTHTWKVRAIDAAGNISAWSNTSTFTIKLNDTTAPSVPELFRPVNNYVARRNEVLLNWLAANDEFGIAGYEVMFNDSIYDAGSALEITVSVQESGDLTWKARSIDRAGNISAWSEERTFIVLGMDELTDQNTLSIHPNPANDVLNISGDLQINKVTVIDLSGKIMQTIESENIQSVDVSGLLNGMYLLICETDEGYIKQMFIKE